MNFYVLNSFAKFNLFPISLALEYDMKAKIAIESQLHPAIIDKIDAVLLEREKIGLMLIDLSDFTQVNVGLGFRIGDKLLSRFKDKLSVLSCGLFFAEHYYGDKFLIICPTLKDDNRLEKYANLLVSYFSRNAVSINSLEVPLEIKLAYITSNAESTGKGLLQALELTMYDLKQKNINIEKASLSSDAELENIYKNVSSHAVVRRAIEKGEITNYYQPIVDLTNSKIIACETLVRWENPVLGVMPPSAFLPHISKHHQLFNLTLNVVRNLIADFQPVINELPDNFYVTINLPPSLLVNEPAINKIISVIEQKGFPFNRLGFEITEQHILTNPGLIDSMSRRLNDLGAKILIDDFGTGHSSIERIANIPAYAIKLDKQFLLNMKHEELNKTVIRFALEVANQKEAILVCEGVADEYILELVKSLGVNFGQGFLFYKAISFEELKRVVLR